MIVQRVIDSAIQRTSLACRRVIVNCAELGIYYRCNDN